MMDRLLVLYVAAVLALVLPACRAENPTQLPALAARLDETTVSGLSAGAYMAGQFQLAHAAIVVGAGLVAGGPFACAESRATEGMRGPGAAFVNSAKALNGCMMDNLRAWGVPDPARSADRARQLAGQALIDPIDKISQGRVYLFSGKADKVVAPSIVAAAAEFYDRVGVPRGAIMHVTEVASGHALVTEGKGLPCGETGEPYLNACNYDLVGEMLRHLLRRLEPPSAAPTGEFVTFDQAPFAGGTHEHGLARDGLVYIPVACRGSTPCRVHIAFHGCRQSRAVAGDAFSHDGGYARWADTNRLVVLFPQVAASVLNPQGCWDWWGYSGADFLTRSAPQIRAVRRMLDRLASARGAP